jgi:hypothetical protein
MVGRKRSTGTFSLVTKTTNGIFLKALAGGYQCQFKSGKGARSYAQIAIGAATVAAQHHHFSLTLPLVS